MNRTLNSCFIVVVGAGVVSAQGICRRFRTVPARCDLSATPAAQAKCLLRPVKKFANLGPQLPTLPAPFDTILGQPTQTFLTLDQVIRFLAAKGITEAEIGGPLSVKLTAAKYFVIHDTSDFLGDLGSFPPNINDASARINKLSLRANQKISHVYIDRVGQSLTAVNFESTSPPSGTKFGLCNRAQRSAFLHIENIQPRIRDRSVRLSNDAIAPEPGFTDAQLERLAVIYLVASARAGKWLIPAYHSPIDLGFPDAHDDPQNFNLQTWSTKLRDLIEQIGRHESAADERRLNADQNR